MSSIAHLVSVDETGIVPENGAPKPERLVSGAPVHRIWNVEDDEQGTYAGTWESTPGEWRVKYDEWEFCQILLGSGALTDDEGRERRYAAGDAFVIRRGFQGTWRVDETTRKRYVIRT